MTADALNGTFEFTGSLLTFNNVRHVIIDRGYAGIWWPAIVFFLSWGLWNLWFYPHLGQTWSFFGGAMLCTANIAWAGVMLAYGKKK
jgi:hypothetical protein